jgi:hypothetical protein
VTSTSSPEPLFPSTRRALTRRIAAGQAAGRARSLYERAGFRYRGPFGAYRPSPNSVFMTLDLMAAPARVSRPDRAHPPIAP